MPISPCLSFCCLCLPRGVESTKNSTYDQVELSLVRLLFYDSKAVFPKTRVTKSSVSCFVLELTQNCDKKNLETFQCLMCFCCAKTYKATCIVLSKRLAGKPMF